ncbi:hypothetical protein L6452_03016 [Arctium lappa]|uniref:Uncharacterized protein n=1 Tax=Arctium lappa TaxID=4217 RepID=A0ACB9FLW6_ARCLA|nr:hypothetical protein L6452_03016 [Arctium lappa]
MTNRKKQCEKVFLYKPLRKGIEKTKLRIRFVDHIYSCNFMSIKYSYFEVTREDGTNWHFSEADFASLELQDLIFLLRDLKTRTIRPGEVTDALETVKRYMKCAMKLASIEDFQIGLESNQAKINLLKPDLSLPSDAQNVPVFSVLKFPELGMTYVNDKYKLKRSIDQDVKGIQLLDPNYKCLVLQALALSKNGWSIEIQCDISRSVLDFKRLVFLTGMILNFNLKGEIVRAVCWLNRSSGGEL